MNPQRRQYLVTLLGTVIGALKSDGDWERLSSCGAVHNMLTDNEFKECLLPSDQALALALLRLLNPTLADLLERIDRREKGNEQGRND